MFKKILIVILCVLIGIAIIWGIGFYSINSYVKTHQEEIQAEIIKQAGFPIHFEGLQTKLKLSGPYLAIKNIRLILKGHTEPFLTIEQVELHPYLFQSIRNRRFVLKEVVINSPQIELEWNSQTQTVNIKEFKHIDDKSKTEAFPLLLKLPFELKINQGYIVFYTQTLILTEIISGTLYKSQENSNQIHFSGNQTLAINEGEFFSQAPITFKADLDKKIGLLSTKLNEAEIKADWILDEYINCTIDFNNFNLAFMHENVVLTEQDPAWLRWITNGLQEGSLKGKFIIKKLTDQLTLNGNLKFDDLTLKYAKAWPTIQDMQGEIKIENEKITVDVEKGQMMELSLEKALATIEPINTKQWPKVVVNGNVNGYLEQALNFLDASPLKTTLLPTLSTLDPKGKMNLNLRLEVPTQQVGQVNVEGNVKVKDANIFLTDLNLPVTKINGTFAFNNKGVISSDAQGQFEGKEVKISATPEFIIAETQLSIDLLKQHFTSPILDYFQGETKAKIHKSQKENKLIIDSNLEGIKIDLPYPLRKEANTVQDFTFTSGKEDSYNYYLFNAKDLIDGKLSFLSENNNLTLKNGHIVLGKGTADWINQNVLMISGSLKSLDINQWKNYFSEKALMKTQLPIKLYLYIENLIFNEMNLLDLWLGYDSQKPNMWYLDSPTIKGNITLATPTENKYIFDLEHLKIKEEQDKKQLKSKILSTQNKSEISFNTKNLNLSEVSYGQVAFNLIPSLNGYTIKGLKVNNGHFFLEAEGDWDSSETNPKTSLKGQILSDNLGQAFSEMDLSSTFDGGQGRLQFDLQWLAAPYEFSLKNAEGIAYLQMKGGRIKGVNAGLGRILGLLNLDTIRRRLQLDFSDVLKDGFVYDSLDGSFKFQNGIAQTNDFYVNGPSAKIDLSGNINLENKALDLRMTVTPTVVSSSLPIAAGLASGNPAVGLGVWVVDKITGSKISNVAQHRYHVIGTWDAPRIEELNQ